MNNITHNIKGLGKRETIGKVESVTVSNPQFPVQHRSMSQIISLSVISRFNREQQLF